MEDDVSFSDCEDDAHVDEEDVEPHPTQKRVAGVRGGGALFAIETELGLLDLPKNSAGPGQKMNAASHSATLSAAAKKRRRKKMKEKHLTGDPFAVASPLSHSSSSATATSTLAGNLRLLPSIDDDRWVAKMGLAAAAGSKNSTSPVVVTYTSKKKGLASTTTTTTTKKKIVPDDDDDDGLDLDMERTRLEILKYETERTRGKKATAAKMKEYLEELGARPPEVGAYRNPEHRQNFVKKKSKLEEKERRIRKEMGLKVDNHEERRKERKRGAKRKRKELGVVGSTGKWNAKTATLKISK